MIKEEMRMLVACAKEGSAMIDQHMRKAAPERFVGHAPFLPPGIDTFEAMADFLYSKSADSFYVFLSVCFATDDPGKAREYISGLDRTKDLKQSLRYIEHALYAESDFERELSANIHANTALDDEQIKAAFSARFNVSPMSLMELPTDRSVYFAKVNHGYWEYMRVAYAENQAASERFRNIDAASKMRRLRTSGVTQLWGRQISRYLDGIVTTTPDRHVSLSVSLTAGTEAPSVSIRRELNEVTRGAAIGLLSMFEAALPLMNRYNLGDGGATRALITNSTLEPFFQKYVADSDACVFVVPSHLKQIGFVNYSGRTYKFIVPPTRVNETWKVVAATLLGYLIRLSKHHRSITLLGQGASIASLMALLFADVDALKEVRLRYFDLGRVLDVAEPEFLRKQAWSIKHFDDYVEEGRKVFCNGVDAGISLVTLP